jgi:hypothetical protein
MLEAMYLTNNSVYFTASYAKILVAEGCCLIQKPSLVTSFCVGMLYTKDYTPAKFAIAFPRVFIHYRRYAYFLY